MNAGAYDGEISHVIESAEVINDKNEVVVLSKEELELGYRSSIVMKKNYIVLSAKFKLKKAEISRIKETVDELTKRRKKSNL